MEFQQKVVIRLKLKNKTRYGENPQQDGALYEIEEITGINLEKFLPITNAEQLNGKPMSFNNWLDADGVLKMLWQFKEPFATVFKHVNPSGAAQDENILEAYKKAWNCDPQSAFGGVAGVNRPVTKELAEYVTDGKFLEVMIAPDYEDNALEILCQKKNLRILKIDTKMPEEVGYDIRVIYGGFLIQEFDFAELRPEDLIYPEGIKRPTKNQIEDMIFGWKINRRTKSNTVLLIKNKATIGIGAGQQNRVDASFIACWRANKDYKKLKSFGLVKDLTEQISLSTEGRTQGSVAVSCAFFPFPDSIYVLHKFGISAVLSPAGSIRDELTYKALRECDMAAAHTPYVEKGGYKGGIRAFLH